EKMVRIGLKLIVEDDSITFDYASSDRQVKGYINSTLANTYSASYMALFTTIDPDIRHNEGAFRPLKIIAPAGTVVNCSEPAPCATCTTSAAATIIEAAWLALSQAVPELTQAAWARYSAPVSMGLNPHTGKLYSDIHSFAKGGAGATFGFDGWDHLGVVICSGSQLAPDPELHELAEPFFILCYEYLQNSPGAGQWRGGMGTKYVFRIESDDIVSNNFGDGLLPETAPYGLVGGKGAKPSRLRLIKADGEIIDPGVHKFVALNKGDIYEVFETGGGGYGNPFERPVEMVRADVRNELISIESALTDYDVVIDPQTLNVDYNQTNELRGNKKRANAKKQSGGLCS
ncbi:MAG: hydantoinase B/oxoprolinase family protein, partial [Firmicutes bacterium]|nr:hydantoinase B/oxoprolinase family protein [Bacillota bacterium]